MPLVMVHRNGPPAALLCPVWLCDACDRPIQDIHMAMMAYAEEIFYEDGVWGDFIRDEHGHVWQSPVYVAHKRRCLDVIEEAIAPREKPGRCFFTEELTVAMEQLATNTSRPFPDERNVEWVAPSPSRWRRGKYEEATSD
jgi:hypothetical protein